jgi:hypothetical protein
MRRAGTPIAYTYDVYWEESDISWDHRWDGYLRLPQLWVKLFVRPSEETELLVRKAFLCAHMASLHEPISRDSPMRKPSPSSHLLSAAQERARWLSVLISAIVAVSLAFAAAVMVRRAVREQSARPQFLCEPPYQPVCEPAGALRECWQSRGFHQSMVHVSQKHPVMRHCIDGACLVQSSDDVN